MNTKKVLNVLLVVLILAMMLVAVLPDRVFAQDDGPITRSNNFKVYAGEGYDPPAGFVAAASLDPHAERFCIHVFVSSFAHSESSEACTQSSRQTFLRQWKAEFAKKTLDGVEFVNFQITDYTGDFVFGGGYMIAADGTVFLATGGSDAKKAAWEDGTWEESTWEVAQIEDIDVPGVVAFTTTDTATDVYCIRVFFPYVGVEDQCDPMYWDPATNPVYIFGDTVEGANGEEYVMLTVADNVLRLTLSVFTDMADLFSARWGPLHNKYIPPDENVFNPEHPEIAEDWAQGHFDVIVTEYTGLRRCMVVLMPEEGWSTMDCGYSSASVADGPECPGIRFVAKPGYIGFSFADVAMEKVLIGTYNGDAVSADWETFSNYSCFQDPLEGGNT